MISDRSPSVVVSVNDNDQNQSDLAANSKATQTSAASLFERRNRIVGEHSTPVPRDIPDPAELIKYFEYCEVLQDKSNPEIITIVKETISQQTVAKTGKRNDAKRITYRREVVEPSLEPLPEHCKRSDFQYIRDSMKAAQKDFPDYHPCKVLQKKGDDTTSDMGSCSPTDVLTAEQMNAKLANESIKSSEMDVPAKIEATPQGPQLDTSQSDKTEVKTTLNRDTSDATKVSSTLNKDTSDSTKVSSTLNKDLSDSTKVSSALNRDTSDTSKVSSTLNSDTSTPMKKRSGTSENIRRSSPCNPKKISYPRPPADNQYECTDPKDKDTCDCARKYSIGVKDQQEENGKSTYYLIEKCDPTNAERRARDGNRCMVDAPIEAVSTMIGTVENFFTGIFKSKPASKEFCSECKKLEQEKYGSPRPVSAQQSDFHVVKLSSEDTMSQLQNNSSDVVNISIISDVASAVGSTVSYVKENLLTIKDSVRDSVHNVFSNTMRADSKPYEANIIIPNDLPDTHTGFDIETLDNVRPDHSVSDSFNVEQIILDTTRSELNSQDSLLETHPVDNIRIPIVDESNVFESYNVLDDVDSGRSGTFNNDNIVNNLTIPNYFKRAQTNHDTPDDDDDTSVTPRSFIRETFEQVKINLNNRFFGVLDTGSEYDVVTTTTDKHETREVSHEIDGADPPENMFSQIKSKIFKIFYDEPREDMEETEHQSNAPNPGDEFN